MKSKSKYFIFFIYLYLGNINAMAGAIADRIEQECPSKFHKYEEIVHQYSVRMKDNVFTYGCGVISAYAIFAEHDMNRIEQWEDEPQNFEIVNTVVQIADEYGLDIAGQPILFDAIGNLVGSGDETIIEAFEAALAKTNRWERKIMNSEPVRILYMMWATQLKHGGSSKEILDTYDRLMQDIPIYFLPAALILDGQIENAYQFLPSKRLDLIKKIVDDYSTEFLERVAGNRMALPNVIFLLPPQSGEIPESQSMTNEELERIRRDYATGIKAIAEHIEQRNNIGIAMEATSFFAPYILDTLKEGCSVRMIVAYLQDQISTQAFSNYLSRISECTEEDFVAYLGEFFRFLAPHQEEDGKEIEYLQHNLARIVRWYIEDKDTLHQWMEQTQDPDDFIRNISWLPYYREQLEPKGQEMLAKLLLQLSTNVDDNANFIVAIMHESRYFEWAQAAPDSYAIVTPTSEEVHDQSGPKYRYILTTPFPSKTDSSVFEQFVNIKLLNIGHLYALQSKSVEDLEKHNFTNLEKGEAFVSTADNIIALVSIAAIPVTGGASILLVASRIAAKKAAKKGLKYGLKVGYRYVRSTVNQNTRNSASKLIKPEKMWREIKELGGFAQKRGRPSQYAGVQKDLSKGIDTFNRITTPIIISFSLSSLAIDMACSQHIEGANEFLDKMCGNNEENSQQVDNVCRSFNKRRN